LLSLSEKVFHLQWYHSPGRCYAWTFGAHPQGYPGTCFVVGNLTVNLVLLVSPVVTAIDPVTPREDGREGGEIAELKLLVLRAVILALRRRGDDEARTRISLRMCPECPGVTPTRTMVPLEMKDLLRQREQVGSRRFFERSSTDWFYVARLAVWKEPVEGVVIHFGFDGAKYMRVLLFCFEIVCF